MNSCEQVGSSLFRESEKHACAFGVAWATSPQNPAEHRTRAFRDVECSAQSSCMKFLVQLGRCRAPGPSGSSSSGPHQQMGRQRQGNMANIIFCTCAQLRSWTQKKLSFWYERGARKPKSDRNVSARCSGKTKKKKHLVLVIPGILDSNPPAPSRG